jgi:CxxC motif-containing protein (DUF1111 family)
VNGRGNSRALGAVLVLSLVACEGAPGPRILREDPTDLPMEGLTADEELRFNRGDVLIERVFREADGLGPVYIEASCTACHADDGRGPGKVERMIVANADGTQAADQTALPYGTVVRRHYTAGATAGVLPPDGVTGLRLSTRFGPALFGRGRMEAIAEEAIVAEAARQAAAGRVSGRVNRLGDGTIGRFGVKARVSSLEVFVADAFRGDMGLTSRRFPMEVPNPDGLADDRAPGVDVDEPTIVDIAHYIRTLALPRRQGSTARGAQLLAATGCLDCHVNHYQTRADHAVAALAGIAADVYSDLLLHDLGSEASDGINDGQATGREWKTAPLVGLRFFRSFLHDGRARSVDEAIRMHAGEGSEANASVTRYIGLTEAEREVLLDHLGSL